MTTPQKWTDRDGWILMSLFLVHCDEGATLTALVGAADATNHAIPTFGELSRALTRLSNAGVISVTQKRFKISSNYMDELENVKSGKGGLFSLPEKGKKWLCSKSLDTETNGTVTITSEELTDAYQQYTQSLRRRKSTNNSIDRSGGSAAS
jgi:hypothetical protein